MGKKEEAVVEVVPELYERREARYKGVYRVFASTIMACICLIWSYRLINIPTSGSISSDDLRPRGSSVWIGIFAAEIGFGFYWIITQSVRWSLVRFYPFKERLSTR